MSFMYFKLIASNLFWAVMCFGVCAQLAELLKNMRLYSIDNIFLVNTLYVKKILLASAYGIF